MAGMKATGGHSDSRQHRYVRPPRLATGENRTTSRLELFYDLAYVLVVLPDRTGGGARPVRPRVAPRARQPADRQVYLGSTENCSWWLTGSPLLQPRTIGSYRCRFLLHCGRPVHVRLHPISEVGRAGARWAQAVSVRDVSDAEPLVCAWVYGATSGVRPVGSSAVYEQAAQRAGEAFGAPGHGRQ
jgi:hypothetical protein